MKLFKKERLPNGRRHIYFCGIKVFSYRHKKCKRFYYKCQNKIPNLLCYTCANAAYFPFAILYPIFVLNSNKDVAVEIGIENYDLFISEYQHLIEYYDKHYPDKVYFHSIESNKKVQPGTMRFITQPLWRGKYVYIGDVDIMITEEIAKPHIKNIKKNNLDFSNIKRKGVNKLSGLHFIQYDKMYPLKLNNKAYRNYINDEEFLYLMMKNRGYKIPEENTCTFRPILGVHFSFFSRPPLPTLTTMDRLVKFPSWFETINQTKSYLSLRYSNNVKDFMAHVRETDVCLRKIIQHMDVSVWYYLNNKKLKSIRGTNENI